MGLLNMSKFHNKTRQSTSIPSRLLREGKFYLIPIYYLLRTSDLAREGIENSGSYRFADHVYANKPSGKFVFGKLLDSVLLKLKSARSMRSRYVHAKKEIYNLIESVQHQDSIDILTVPCGLTREFFEVAQELKDSNNPIYERIRWHGIDLDQELIERMVNKKDKHALQMFFSRGDALREVSYQENKGYDMIISTGLSEFLDDQDTLDFYKIAYIKLKKDGVFFTSGMRPHKLSDYLMRTFAELHTHYRTEEDLKKLAYEAEFRNMHAYQDELQTILIGIKE
jgi:hypothetical protein